MRFHNRFSYLFVSAAFLAVLGSCQKPRDVGQSDLDVTDVHHTPSKRQSIGNCWLYATATWAESLNLSETSQPTNLSESYWTYWHFYSVIPYASDKLQTGGHWRMASQIIREHGWMEEGEFLPEESTQEMSLAQSRAESFVNRELQDGGRLADSSSRTRENVMAVLDEAFGVSMEELQLKARSASEYVIGHDQEGNPIGLDQALSGSGTRLEWRGLSYPQVYGKGAVASSSQKRTRVNILKRVMRALNDRQPVIISSMVDFNALKIQPYATFDLKTLQDAGRMGSQGGHLLVLEDYTVKNVPGIGDLGEGDMTPEIKAKAIEGEVVYLKAKNSWGMSRPERGLIDGHTSFTMEYLDAVLPWAQTPDSTDENAASWSNPLSQFILPPGY